MAPLKLSLDYDRPAALLESDHDGQPQWIYLVINWQDREIYAETRARDDNTQPESRWRGLEDTYLLPPLTDATQLREWVEEEVLPRAAPLADAFHAKLGDDLRPRGTFPGHEQGKTDFDAWIDSHAPPLHDGGLWAVEDWLSHGVDEVSHETTDAAIETLADTIVDEAARENVAIVAGREAVRAYLLDYRQDLRDAIPEPDCYQIQGYEVVEKTVMPFGASAHIPVSKAWRGKRVKVVRLDP
jgi:hypothetical protein